MKVAEKGVRLSGLLYITMSIFCLWGGCDARVREEVGRGEVLFWVQRCISYVTPSWLSGGPNGPLPPSNPPVSDFAGETYFSGRVSGLIGTLTCLEVVEITGPGFETLIRHLTRFFFLFFDWEYRGVSIPFIELLGERFQEMFSGCQAKW